MEMTVRLKPTFPMFMIARIDKDTGRHAPFFADEHPEGTTEKAIGVFSSEAAATKMRDAACRDWSVRQFNDAKMLTDYLEATKDSIGVKYVSINPEPIAGPGPQRAISARVAIDDFIASLHYRGSDPSRESGG